MMENKENVYENENEIEMDTDMDMAMDTHLTRS